MMRQPFANKFRLQVELPEGARWTVTCPAHPTDRPSRADILRELKNIVITLEAAEAKEPSAPRDLAHA
jgi:hypothetical protein